MTKVAIITLWYPQDIRIFREVSTLQEEYSIEIFLTDTQKTEPEKENLDDVIVHRFSYTSSKYRIGKYIHSFLRYLKITRKAIKSNPEICHVHDFPLLFSGILVKLVTQCNLVYDAHEDFASMVYLDNTVRVNALRKVELFLIRLFVDHIITVNESLKAYFSQAKVKTSVLMNVPALSIQTGGKASKSNDFMLGYVGHIHTGRGYETLIPLCLYLIQSNLAVKFLIVGGGPFEREFRKMVNAHNLGDHFIMTGEVDHREIPSFLQRINVGLILFKPICYNNIIATPNKLFEYMAFGIPVVASNVPEIRKIMEETNAGILVDPTNLKEVAETVMYLAKNPKIAKEMGENGRKAFATKYNWDAQSKELLKVYKEFLQ